MHCVQLQKKTIINVICTVCAAKVEKGFCKKNRRNKNKNVWFRRVSLGIPDCAIIFTKNNYFHIFGKY